MDLRPSDATRTALLEAAFTEMHRCGFQAASLSQILANTGLTKGALYHHFTAKRVLGLAVIDEVIRVRLEESVFRPLRESEQPVATLLSILELKARAVDDEWIRLGCPLNNLVQEMSPIDADFRQRLADLLSTWQGSLKAALRKGQDQKQVRAEVDCEAASLFILASWEGCWGIAKSLQSATVFRSGVAELRAYVQGLAPAATASAGR